MGYTFFAPFKGRYETLIGVKLIVFISINRAGVNAPFTIRTRMKKTVAGLFNFKESIVLLNNIV